MLFKQADFHLSGAALSDFHLEVKRGAVWDLNDLGSPPPDPDTSILARPGVPPLGSRCLLNLSALTSSSPPGLWMH